jgi:hypothetical protein
LLSIRSNTSPCCCVYYIRYWTVAEEYKIFYSFLPSLLTTHIDGADTFIDLDISNYKFLIKIVAVVRSRTSAFTSTDIESLKDSYESVRSGDLRDPQTIRDIAARFVALAKDPNMDVNALKAAEILRHRAWIYEQKIKEKSFTGVTADPVEQPDRKENDQAHFNIFAGG